MKGGRVHTCPYPNAAMPQAQTRAKPLHIRGILNSVTRFKDRVDMRAVKKHGGARPGSGPRPGPPTKVVRLPVPLAEFARKLAAARKPGDVAAFLHGATPTPQ